MQSVNKARLVLLPFVLCLPRQVYASNIRQIINV